MLRPSPTIQVPLILHNRLSTLHLPWWHHYLVSIVIRLSSYKHWVSEQLSSCLSAARINSKHLLEETHGTHTHILGLVVDALLDLSLEFTVSVRWEGEIATEEEIVSYTARPNVYWRSSIFFLRDNLRGHVNWSTTEKLKWFSAKHCKAKVYQFNHFRHWIYDDVFEFNVTMTYVPLMQVV